MQLYEQLPNFNFQLILKPLIELISKEDRFMLLNSNTDNYPNSKYDFLIAIKSAEDLTITKCETESIEQMRDFYNKKKDWIFGHISYDFKNCLEKLESKNPDNIQFPLVSFFRPKILIIGDKTGVKIYIHSKSDLENEKQLLVNISKIVRQETYEMVDKKRSKVIQVTPRINQQEYKKGFEKIKELIQNGEAYEINYCQEFYSEGVELEISEIYNKLNQVSNTPFSAFYGYYEKKLASASPERYIKKEGQKIISQPIKGTITRHQHEEKDKENAKSLLNNTKERAENVMIVDLVRNDLSRTAKKGSVKVDELFGIYSFPQVHQMISTISSELKPEFDIFDVIATTFPMGSMTGAPKISAMKIIDEIEKTARGLYSGTVGYINPDGDADFNVIIRSLQYNRQTKHLSYITGGAITIMSDADSEYNECLLKGKAISKVLKNL